MMLATKIRAARTARGLGQSALAHEAGISRQMLSAIETGASQPGVAVALRLARVLGETVESLFAQEDGAAERIDAQWKDRGARSAAAVRARVVLGRVGGKVVAIPQPAARIALAPAAGMVERQRRQRAEVSTFRSRAEIDSTLLIAGCDPAVGILADWLARKRSPISAVGLPCSSTRALDALLDGRAHAAGVHLKDPASGEYNLAPVRRILAHRRTLLVNFSRWELGLATAASNPLKLRAIADLGRPGIRVANREPGSGARAALDEALAKAGLRADRISGYRHELNGHLEVAAAVAQEQADVGVTIRVAAEAYGLGFVPLREERYDLVILEREAQSLPVKAMLEALNSRRFAREVSQLCAYDTDQMGQVQKS